MVKKIIYAYFSYYLGFYNFKIFWIFFPIFLDFPKFYPRCTTYRFARDNMLSPAHRRNAPVVKNYPQQTAKFTSGKHYRRHVGRWRTKMRQG
jgi:hypothetical protein